MLVLRQTNRRAGRTSSTIPVYQMPLSGHSVQTCERHNSALLDRSISAEAFALRVVPLRERSVALARLQCFVWCTCVATLLIA